MKPKTLSSFRLAVSLVVTVLIAATSTAQAQTQEAYAVSNDNTLSFYYDAYRASRPGTIHSISSQADVPSWVNLTDLTPLSRIISPPAPASGLLAMQC